MGRPFPYVEFGILAASYDGRYYSRWWRGDKPSGAIFDGANALHTPGGMSANGGARFAGVTATHTPGGMTASGGGEEVFDFYISPTGNDANAGTLASPWAITALNTRRATYAGQRVGLLDGTYDISGMPNYLNDGQNNPYPIFQIAGGSSGSPTVIQSVTPRGAHLNLRSSGGARNIRPAIGQYGSAHGNGYVTIDGLRISGGGMWLMSWWGAVATNTSNPRQGWKPGVVVQNCQLHDSLLPNQDNNPAVWLDKCLGPIVRNNLFYDIYDAGGPGAYGPCAVMTLSVRGLVFERNEVYNTRVAVHDKHNNGNDYASDGFIIRYNYVHDLQNYWIIGLDTEYINNTPAGAVYQNSVVHNNVVVGARGGWYCKGNSPTRMGVAIYNNTFVLTSNADGGFIGTMAAVVNKLDYYNNIIVKNGFSFTSFGELGVSIGAEGVIDHNMYGSTLNLRVLNPINSTSWAGTSYTSLSAWRTATSRDTNSIQATPTFVGGAGAGAYALAAGSAGLNAGRVGGVSGGAACHMGAWDGIAAHVSRDWS